MLGINEKKYSFIIHTEQKKSSHGWQESIIFEIKEQLAEASDLDNKIFNDLLDLSYNNLRESMVLQDTEIPSFEVTKEEVRFSLRKDHIMVTVVNSEKDVKELLDDSGQLN